VQGILRGESIRKSLDLTNWEAASELVRDWEIEGHKDIPSVSGAMERFISDMEARGLSPDTIAKFRLLGAELPDCRIDSLTADYIAKIREKWELKASTAAKKLERLKSFFRFCENRKWLTDNPAKGLRPPKETAIEKKPYDNDELEKITWAIPLFPIKGIYGEENRERIKAFISVLRWTGLRIRDVVQLKRSAVDEHYITVRTHKNGKPVQRPVHPELKRYQKCAGKNIYSGPEKVIRSPVSETGSGHSEGSVRSPGYISMRTAGGIRSPRHCSPRASRCQRSRRFWETVRGSLRSIILSGSPADKSLLIPP
jgi:hypothetical protein